MADNLKEKLKAGLLKAEKATEKVARATYNIASKAPQAVKEGAGIVKKAFTSEGSKEIDQTVSDLSKAAASKAKQGIINTGSSIKEKIGKSLAPKQEEKQATQAQGEQNTQIPPQMPLVSPPQATEEAITATGATAALPIVGSGISNEIKQATVINSVQPPVADITPTPSRPIQNQQPEANAAQLKEITDLLKNQQNTQQQLTPANINPSFNITQPNVPQPIITTQPINREVPEGSYYDLSMKVGGDFRGVVQETNPVLQAVGGNLENGGYANTLTAIGGMQERG